MRLEVTRRAELAVLAMRALGDAPGRIKAPTLAEVIGTTTGFLSHVMAPLARAGWVRSDPGPRGGYQLIASLDSVSVLAVIEAVDGVTGRGRCVVEDRACDGRSECVMHTAWTAARDELTGRLGRTMLADVGRP